MQHMAGICATIGPATSGAGVCTIPRLDAARHRADLQQRDSPGDIAMRLALLAAAALSAGCAFGDLGHQRITHRSDSVSFTTTGFSAFAAAGPLVEIRGAPPGGATPAEVLPTLRLPGWWPQTAFRLAQPGEAPTAQRIVLAFGVPGGVSASIMCRDDFTPTPTTTLTAAAAFCRGHSGATVAKLTDDRPLTPDDPAFASAMTSLFDAIAPRRDPAHDNDPEPIIVAP
jgi:hypothetical protein